MTTIPLEDDEDSWTEAHSATVPRVDLVAKAANGTGTWLLAKADASGLLAPETVRALIKEATPEPTTNFVSPADLMAAIHRASAPSKENPMTQTVLAKADGGTCPSCSAAPCPACEAAGPDCCGAACCPGCTCCTCSTCDSVRCPACANCGADCCPGGVCCDGCTCCGMPEGDPDDVGSPAWEAVDAARARQALQLTVALQRLVMTAKDRENQEVALGDGDDLGDVWTLEDVCAAIDAIIDMLAPFAVTEQAEADQGAAMAGADAMTKAAALIKAGRVLSSANEAKIRGAADALQAVLGSLPAPSDDAAPVAKGKETKVSDTLTKAKGDPQVAVYSSTGALVGTVDQADVNPIAEVAPPEGADPVEPPADETEPTPGVPPAEPAPIVQPGATDGPAAVAKEEAPPIDEENATDQSADDEPVVKSDDKIALLKSTLENALERLEHLEKQPMPGGPMLNGALPGDDGPALRGQSDTGSNLRKAYEDETNPFKKQELRTQLALDGIRNAPPLR